MSTSPKKLMQMISEAERSTLNLAALRTSYKQTKEAGDKVLAKLLKKMVKLQDEIVEVCNERLINTVAKEPSLAGHGGVKKKIDSLTTTAAVIKLDERRRK